MHKPRCTVSSVYDKGKILYNCTIQENPPENQKLFITLDLTSYDQEVNKDLRAKLKELDKEGSL